MRCRTSFPLCALVRVFCVRPYSTAVCGTGCARHAQHFGLQNGILDPLNGSFFSLRGLTRRAFYCKREGRQFSHFRQKGWSFSIFLLLHLQLYLRCTYWEHDCSAGSVTRCDWSGYVWVADVCGLACRPASGQRGTRFAGGVAGPRQTNKQRSTTARVEAMVYAQLGQQPLVRTTETSPEPG